MNKKYTVPCDVVEICLICAVSLRIIISLAIETMLMDHSLNYPLGECLRFEVRNSPLTSNRSNTIGYSLVHQGWHLPVDFWLTESEALRTPHPKCVHFVRAFIRCHQHGFHIVNIRVNVTYSLTVCPLQQRYCTRTRSHTHSPSLIKQQLPNSIGALVSGRARALLS